MSQLLHRRRSILVAGLFALTAVVSAFSGEDKGAQNDGVAQQISPSPAAEKNSDSGGKERPSITLDMVSPSGPESTHKGPAKQSQVSAGAPSTPSQGRIAPQNDVVNAPPTSPASDLNKSTALALEKLNRVILPEDSVDLFKPKSWYVPPPPPPPPQSVAPPKPTAPSLPFTYMGELEDSGKLTIFLARGDQALEVRQGTVIDKDYRVESVTEGQITFVYVPLNMKQQLARETK